MKSISKWLSKGSKTNTRLVRWLLLPLAIFVLITAAMGAWVYYSESGLNWGFRQLKFAIPKQLNINEVSGSLSTQVKFKQVSWLDDNIEIEADQLMLQCNWFRLFFRQVNCLENSIKQLNISIRNKQSTSLAGNKELTDYLTLPLKELISPSLFSGLELPFSFSLESTRIDLIKIESIDDHASSLSSLFNEPVQSSRFQSPFTISKLSINELYLEQRKSAKSNQNPVKLSFSRLELSSRKHQLSSQLKMVTKDSWSYELALAVSGDDIDSSLSSKGELFAESTFALETQSPVKSIQNGRWSWSNKLIANSVISLEKQSLSQGKALPVINSAQAKLNIDWPEADIEYQSDLAWVQFQKLNLNGTIESKDILNWRLNSKAHTNIATHITQSHWQSLKQATANLTEDDLLSAQKVISKFEPSNSPTTATIATRTTTNANSNSNSNSNTPTKKALNKLVPINIELLSQIDQSNVTIFTQQFEFAELSGLLNFTGKLVDFTLPTYQLKAKLNAKSFEFDQLNLSGGNADLTVKQHEDRLSISTKGKITQLQMQSNGLTNLSWDLNLAEKWLGQINLKKLFTNQQSFGDIYFELIGNENDHRISGSFTPAGYHAISLELKGKLDKDKSGSDFNWNINQLTANTELDQSPTNDHSANKSTKPQNFKFEATGLHLSANKQSVEQLCLQDFGKACISAAISNGEWSAQLLLEQFKLRPLTRLPNLQSLKGLSGELSGKLQATGIQEKLSTLIIDVNSPILTYEQSQTKIELIEFSVSNSNPSGTSISSQWRQLSSRYSTPQWNSSITAKDGQANWDINKNGENNFLVSQQVAYWILPHMLNQDSEKDSVSISKKSLLIDKVILNGKLTTNELISDLEIALATDDFVHASNRIDWPITNQSSLDSKVELKITQLDWLKQWQSRIDKLSGSWTHQLEITGTPASPVINGVGEITLSQLAMEELGLDIKDSSISMISNDYTTNLSGVLKNNQGELKLEGEATISPEFSASLDLNGDKITLIDSSEYKLIVSPKLKASIRRSHLEVSGNVDINEAKVTISQLPTKSVNVSDDEVIVTSKNIQEEPFTYNIAVKVNATDNVSIKGFGLTSEVVGKLSSNAQTGKPLDINGQLFLQNGQFEAYKQVLTIEQGQLLFLGNPENPGIQFKASRKIEETVVGVIASGSLADPSLRLYSEPAMADEQVLALLLTGRSLESLTQQEGNALANAAISLGVSEANRLAAKIADVLGIKNINITTKTKAESTRVDIGTQVNDRLSVGFGTNIDSTNQLNSGWIIEYRLSPSISFEAISGEEVSANITYKKQFDDKDVDKGSKNE